jgi:peroxiredoxin
MVALRSPKRSRFPGVWIFFFPILGILMAVLTITGLPDLFPRTEQFPGNLLTVGNPVPDFTGNTLDGRQIHLSDLKGSIVAVSFWASWCEPCKAEMPVLQSAVLNYSDARFVVLAVNAGEDESSVNSFVSGLNITMPVILDPDKTIFKRYNVVVLPVTIWIDSQGIVRAEHIGSLDQKLIASYMEMLTRAP